MVEGHQTSSGAPDPDRRDRTGSGPGEHPPPAAGAPPEDRRHEDGAPDRRLALPEVPRWLDRAAAISWRGLVVAGAVLALLYLVVQLQPVVIPLLGALVLCTILVPPATWLRRRGLPPLAATWLTFLALVVVVAAVVVLVVPPIADQAGELDTTLGDAVEDVEDWLVEDAPVDISRQDVEDAKDSAVDAARSLGSSGDGLLARGTLLVVEVLTGLFVAAFATFFFVKDGPRMQRWFLDHLPEHRHELARRLAGEAWWTLGGYVRGTAIFGLVEAVLYGIALWVLGSDLILPVVVLTFLAPFLPIVGAIISGVVATLVVLVSSGTGPAIAMAVVALAVQQLDNDLLNPLVYGRTLRLHPLVILLALTSGAALGGFVGAVLAVPVAAVVVNVLGERRRWAAELAGAERTAPAGPEEPTAPAAPGR